MSSTYQEQPTSTSHLKEVFGSTFSFVTIRKIGDRNQVTSIDELTAISACRRCSFYNQEDCSEIIGTDACLLTRKR